MVKQWINLALPMTWVNSNLLTSVHNWLIQNTVKPINKFVKCTGSMGKRGKIQILGCKDLEISSSKKKFYDRWRYANWSWKEISS